MTSLTLFDIPKAPVPPLPVTVPLIRAYCLHCGDFSVLPDTRACSICERPLDRRYDFVELDEEDEWETVPEGGMDCGQGSGIMLCLLDLCITDCRPLPGGSGRMPQPLQLVDFSP